MYIKVQIGLVAKVVQSWKKAKKEKWLEMEIYFYVEKKVQILGLVAKVVQNWKMAKNRNLFLRWNKKFKL